MGRCILDISAGYKLTVAEHCITVGNGKDLRHLMGNKDKGFPLVA